MSAARIGRGGLAVAAVGLLAGCGSSGAHAHHSASPTSTSSTTVTSTRTTAAGAQMTDACLRDGRQICRTPRQFQTAYGVTPLLRHRIDGAGVTVVLPEQAVDAGAADGRPITRLSTDMTAFDARFHLPAAQIGVDRELDPEAAPDLAFGLEEVQDAEIVHALAPGARIRILPARLAPLPTRLPRVFAAAARLGDVVSLSDGEGQQCFSGAELDALHRSLALARARHVSVIASSGDFGAADRPCGASRTYEKGVGIPGSAPLVTGAGGTELSLHSSTGGDASERVWNTNLGHGPPAGAAHLGASGGGFSDVYGTPSYQRGTAAGREGHRGDPDVSASASPIGAMMVVLSVDGHPSIAPGAGTSASAPTWAAIAALADQYAHRPLGFLDPALYRIGGGPDAARAFHDVTAGDNTVATASGQLIDGYRAAPGWDPVTGWGSPNAAELVPLLAREVRRGDSAGF